MYTILKAYLDTGLILNRFEWKEIRLRCVDMVVERRPPMCVGGGIFSMAFVYVREDDECTVRLNHLF